MAETGNNNNITDINSGSKPGAKPMKLIKPAMSSQVAKTAQTAAYSAAASKPIRKNSAKVARSEVEANEGEDGVCDVQNISISPHTVFGLLISLPEAVLSTILSSWLKAANVAHLDSAVCVTAYRSCFLRAAYGPTVVLCKPVFGAFDSDTLDAVTMWMIKRCAVMESLVISDSILLREASNQSYLETRGATVRTVNFLFGRRSEDDPAVNRLTSYIGRYCPNLMTFKSFRAHSEAALTAVVRGCPLLEDLLLRGDTVTDGHIDAFAQWSHQLKSVNIVCSSALSEAAFVRLVQNCHLLDQVFICCIETRLTDAFFVQLALNCPLLTKLEVAHARLGHAGLEAMAAHCRKMRTFSFSEGRIDTAARKSARAFPMLLEATLYEVSIDETSLDALLSCCPALHTLDFL
jgi:hypothetical protein